MPDFGSRWRTVPNTAALGRGGQGHVFLVSDQQAGDSQQYAAKLLNGATLNAESPRWKRLEQEIEVSRQFDHPHVIRVLDAGHTEKSGYPFFVMPVYPGGSLDETKRQRLVSPFQLLEFFAQMCEGVAYIHELGIVHRDLKLANILLTAEGQPVVGDFGLCFRLGSESLTEHMEVATARWFGAPELRNGHLETVTFAADVYSLGKLLYWLFTGRVFDREEQDYGSESRRLSVVVANEEGGINTISGVIDDRLIRAAAFAEEIVDQTVRYAPEQRIPNATALGNKVKQVIARLRADGRPLDLSPHIPQRCAWCGAGGYKPLVPLPPYELRIVPPDPRLLAHQGPDLYQSMRDAAEYKVGLKPGGVGSIAPLILICQNCGHQQIFRLDLAPDAAARWKP